MNEEKIILTYCNEYWYMIIPVPKERDEEEYINEFLEKVLDPKIFYDVEWDFATY